MAKQRDLALAIADCALRAAHRAMIDGCGVGGNADAQAGNRVLSCSLRHSYPSDSCDYTIKVKKIQGG